ncbi:hypothetical protein SteCoe_3336 [Stentor coeruleus]|uniref:Receptor ligand binding region domain-containing protein n=1 Tax=Stentor coeruleus TaxID=5963 RepID=A0A1R2CXD7_9CILI|nr:hypothetical protein SteCoe_3336 [Stentor coeruleus]
MILLVCLLLLSSAYNIAFIGNDKSKFQFLQESFQVFSGQSKFNQYLSITEISDATLSELSLIIDSRDSEISLSQSMDLANKNEIPVLILSPGQNSKFLFFLESSYECITSTIANAVDFFKMTEVGVVWSYSQKNKIIVDMLKSVCDRKLLFVSISNFENPKEIEKIFGKMLKAEGIQDFLFIGDNENCNNYSKGLEASYLTRQGNLAIFLNECVYQINTNGAFILSKVGVLYSNTSTEYNFNMIKPYFSVFQENGLSTYQIAHMFEKVINPCSFDIVNIQNNKRVIVGKADNNDFNITNTAIYFGGKNETTRFSRPQIVISANTGFLNPPGYSNVYQNVKYQKGTYFAVEKVNKDRFYFPKYDLILYDKVDCGVSVFDANYSRDCFIKHAPHMGNAYVPTINTITINILKQLQSLKINIPFIGGGGSVSVLSNKTNFPMFTRMTSSSTLFTIAWSKLIDLYGWSNIMIFYTNDSYGLAIYEVMKKESLVEGFNILNKEEERMINPITNTSQLSIYYDRINSAINIGCNIMFLAMSDPSPFFWLEGLYDVGVKRGDFVYIFFSLTGLDGLNATGGNYTKRAELMHGSLFIYNAAWVGEFGEKVKKDYLNKSNDIWARSFFIDAVLSASNTIDFLLNQGKFFENSTEFMNAQRNTRMEGCTGTISFDHYSNDRNLYYFNLYNFYQDNASEWHGDAVLLISPLSPIYYTALQEPIFAQGKIPSDMKENYMNCPFRESKIQDSKTGEGIKIIVSVGLLIIATILTFYVSKKVKYTKIIPLSVVCQASFQDYLALGFTFVESIQLIAIGPSFIVFNRFLSNASEYISLNLSKAVAFRNTTFWIIFYSMLFSTYVWLLILVLTGFRICGFSKTACKRLEQIKVLSIPILSNYLFIPVTVCILSILACDKATGPDLTDTYLNYDCNTRCWRNKHLVYVVLACFLIITYIPMAILYRTLWQEDTNGLNIRANSKFLVLKNIVFVILIVIAKIIKESSPLAYSIVFTIIMLGLLIYIFYLKDPFNYDRANYILIIMYTCVVWNTLICTLSNSIEIISYPWLILQLVGWVIIISVGLFFIKKLPQNMIIVKRGREISDLFKFAFGKGTYRKSTYDATKVAE